MGAALGLEGTPVNLTLVERALAEDTNAFEFFQAVRLLERLHPERKPVGLFSDPEQEIARFGTHVSLAFPASEIQTLETSDAGPARMTVNFMGLTGPVGVLPYHYTQFLIERLQARDTSLIAFLDLFHHRIISLFYRAWLKHRFHIAYERGEDENLTHHLLDLGGLGLESDQEHLPIAREAAAFYTGLLAAEPRSAVALEQLLGDYFGVPVVIEQFIGGWYRIGVADQCAMDEPVASSQLGRGAVVGDEIWDMQARVRVRIGPLTRAQFDTFLPTGDAHAVLGSLVRLYAHDQFDFEVQLVLEKEEVPPLQLGADEVVEPKLGWSTWIRTVPRKMNAEETVLAL
jgi:type VI secretion system protein ImpH